MLCAPIQACSSVHMPSVLKLLPFLQVVSWWCTESAFQRLQLWCSHCDKLWAPQCSHRSPQSSRDSLCILYLLLWDIWSHCLSAGVIITSLHLQSCYGFLLDFIWLWQKISWSSIMNLAFYLFRVISKALKLHSQFAVSSRMELQVMDKRGVYQGSTLCDRWRAYGGSCHR